jgi:hypothetical protein
MCDVTTNISNANINQYTSFIPVTMTTFKKQKHGSGERVSSQIKCNRR